MPKEVDHPARRRELADAACRVIARNGLAGTTLAHVADESGWSIGSIRYYFPNKDELVASALWRAGERVDERIRRRTAGGMTMNDLRTAATELLPLDADRRDMALVYLAFLAQAAVVPALAAAAEGAAQRLQDLSPRGSPIWYRRASCQRTLTLRIEAARLRVLLDGLRLQLITTPGQTPASWALAILDDHLTALAAPPAATGTLTTPAPAALTALPRPPRLARAASTAPRLVLR